MSMDRREWLTGVVTSVIGAQLALVAKKPLEGVIVPDTEIKLYQPSDVRPGRPGDTLYVRMDDGRMLPIGYIHDMTVSMSREVWDVTTMGSKHREFYHPPRGWEMHGTFSGITDEHVQNAYEAIKGHRRG